MAAPPRNRTTEKAHVDNEAFCGAWRDMQCSRRGGDGGGGGDAFVVGAVYHIAEDLTDITLMDAYSGEVVRRMDGLSRPGLKVCAGGDMICVVSPGDGLLRVVDVATGDLTDLSMGCSAATGRNVSSGYTLGKVPATGEHKLLHVYAAANGSQSSEVLTITAGAGGGCHSFAPPASAIAAPAAVPRLAPLAVPRPPPLGSHRSHRARGCEGAVRLHDPRTGACEEVAQVEKGGCVLGFYSGALALASC
uniref:Uncharacterized protein n=1 Tax=Oryza meridionalis TaxID=40149 RepID=A0A0E0E8T7_9ORYZ